MNIKQLTQLGLSVKEASVYLACLDLGPAKASDIAKKARIIRDTAYFILSELKKKGLVKETSTTRVKRFVATDPMVLKEKLDLEQKILDEKQMIAEQLCSQLLPIFKHKRIMRVELIEGDEARDLLRKDQLASNAVIRNLCSYDEIMKEHPIKVECDMRHNFKNHCRPIYALNCSTQKSGIYNDKSMQCIFVKNQKSPFSGDMTLYENKLIFTHVGDPQHGVLITDDELTNALKYIFDLAYQKSKNDLSHNTQNSHPFA
ncbi:MAG TPA: helix-turn-helix domain-containing protein [Patescibacteria group bacterium]|nr:helix-turn-helix domain-containing protein [Patescibacteria group bacterium]